MTGNQAQPIAHPPSKHPRFWRRYLASLLDVPLSRDAGAAVNNHPDPASASSFIQQSSATTKRWDEAEEQDLPRGKAYDWYLRGAQLLNEDEPAAATQWLSRAAARVPHSRRVLEALARAQFNSEQYEKAAGSFQQLVEEDPEDDYAHFGWGMSAARLGQLDLALEHLAVAVAIRPGVNYYRQALRGAQASKAGQGSSPRQRKVKRG